MGEIKPLLRTNLSSVAIFKLILDINIQAIREVRDENKENPGEYAKTILELGGTLADIPKAGNRWKQIFLESKDRLNEGEQIPYVLSDIYYKNVRWFNTLRSILYIMEEDLLIASQPSVNELWNIFFEIEEDWLNPFHPERDLRFPENKFKRNDFEFIKVKLINDILADMDFSYSTEHEDLFHFSKHKESDFLL